MLKELREKCEQQMDGDDGCYYCPHQEQCEAFKNLRCLMLGLVHADTEPWWLSDYFVEWFDKLIEKMGGEA